MSCERGTGFDPGGETRSESVKRILWFAGITLVAVVRLVTITIARVYLVFKCFEHQ